MKSLYQLIPKTCKAKKIKMINQDSIKVNSITLNLASNQRFRERKTIFVFYSAIYTFTASKKVNLI